MTSKAGGRAALILTTGIWICLGAASQAATAPDNSAAPAAVAKHHHLKKYAHHKSGKVAEKSTADKKSADAAADDSAAIQSSRMPASVANANAQLVSPDTSGTPASNAQAMTDRANNILQAAPADAQATAAAPVVAADQLNDVDRTLQEGAPAAAPVTLASAETPAATAGQPAAAASAGNESSTWDQTSLIGKIFIGFGALLTMASAARMFMA